MKSLIQARKQSKATSTLEPPCGPLGLPPPLFDLPTLTPATLLSAEWESLNDDWYRDTGVVTSFQEKKKQTKFPNAHTTQKIWLQNL